MHIRTLAIPLRRARESSLRTAPSASRQASLITGAALLLVACSSSPQAANLTSTVATSTPIVIYVTPAPTTTAPPPTPIIIYVTPAPTPAPTPTPIVIYITPAPTPQPTTKPLEGNGTLSNPFALGTEFDLGDFTVAVVAVDLDAWPAVRRANMFNDAPPPGEKDVMFKLAVTYNGVGHADPWMELIWDVVGSRGNTFDEECGVLPQDLWKVGDLYEGAHAQGNECVQVPSDQINGALLRLGETTYFEDEAYVALQ